MDGILLLVLFSLCYPGAVAGAGAGAGAGQGSVLQLQEDAAGQPGSGSGLDSGRQQLDKLDFALPRESRHNVVGLPATDTMCVDPGGVTSGRRQPEVFQRPMYPRGTQLHYSCFPGYTLRGLGKMVCGVQRSWEPPTKPTCQPVVCPEPQVDHGQIISGKRNGIYYYGTTVRVLCLEGYRLKDTSVDMMECQLGANWIRHKGQNPLEIPECVEHTCTAPPQLPNSQARVQGNVGWDGGYRPDSVVSYHCSFGFQLEDLRGSRLICRSGRWQPQDPDTLLSKCVQGGCSRPLPIPNGNVVPQLPSIYPYGATMNYYCDPGFMLVGNVYTFQCSLDGGWSPAMRLDTLPSCNQHRAVGCSAPPYISHGHIEKINGSGPSPVSISVGIGSSNNEIVYPENTVARYACEDGYRLEDCCANWIICRAGRWVNPAPICVELSGCSKPPIVQFASVSRRDGSQSQSHHFPLFSKVHYKCLPGFQLLGTPDLVCGHDGCWSPNKPQCILLGAATYGDSDWPHEPQLNEDISEHSHEADSSTSTWSDAHLMTVSAATAGSILGALLLLLLLHRRKWCVRRRRGRHPRHRRRSPPCPPPLPPPHDPDRVALIAFADGVQVVLPTYEEAVRQSGPPPFEAYVGVQRGRGSRGVLPSLPPVRRGRVMAPPPTRDSSADTMASTRQSSSSHSASIRSSDGMGSTDTMAPSELSTTVTLDTLSSGNSTASSQPLSCRGMCGSLASFDTSSILNMEGIPLLEETENENNDAMDSNDQAVEECTG